MTGHDVDIQNKSIETESSQITQSSIVYSQGTDGSICEEHITVVRDKNDPSCGTLTNSNGETYTVTRNEKNQLEVTHSYQDKNGETQSNTTIIEDRSDVVFSVTDHESGTTNNTELNLSNPLDEFIVSNTYQTARIESGYNAYTAMEGGNMLWNCDGDQIEIGELFGTTTNYTMSLSQIE